MKHASVYRHKSQWLLTSMSRTTAGVWIANFVIHWLAVDCPDDELGTTLLASLEASELDVAHPASWPLFHRQLREKLALPMYDLFMARAQLMTVELSESAVVMTPHRNRGLRGGFEPLAQKTALSPREAPELGAAMRQCIAFCT
jgi:hypothetical protein